MSREQILLKTGIGAMSVAIAFTAAVVAVAATLGDEPEPAIAAEPAANVSKVPAARPDLPVKPRMENLERPPTLEDARAEPGAVMPESVKPESVKPESVKPESVKPKVVEVVEPKLEPEPRPEPAPEPAPHPKLRPRPEAKQPTKAKPSPETKSQPKPEPPPKLEAKPDPHPASRPERSPSLHARPDAPSADGKKRQKESALRRPELPPGAIMSLTIKALGIRNAPVRSSDSKRALDNGVVHEPDTSLPWDEGAERNVYLVGHRLGWRGTGSYHVFYNLGRLAKGDEILLKDRRGHRYEYRVTNLLRVAPRDSWVKGAIPGRDMLTLQTCTPIPTFEKRLIVRADRV